MRTMVTIQCDQCGEGFERERRVVRTLTKICKHSYCSRECAGLGKRGPPVTEVELKRRKAAYDAEYRARNRKMLKEKKAKHFREKYTPERTRAERAKRKAAGYDHTAYCRKYYSDPKKKADKVEYDRVRRAKLKYGIFWEAGLMQIDLEKETRARVSWYESQKQRGYFTRASLRSRRERSKC